MRFEALLVPDAVESTFRMRVITPNSRPLGEHPCPTHVRCEFCTLVAGEDGAFNLCDDVKANFSLNASNQQPLTTFATELEYQCGPGRRFTFVDDGGREVTEKSQVRSCDWNGHWQPERSLPQCVWTSCINPPIPPNNSHLVITNYMKDQEVAFGDSVFYECEVGYFFIVDYNLPGFDLECYSDGTWETPADDKWKLCVHPDGN